MSKLFCIGEILIDFIPVDKGVSLKNVTEFKRMPGGAPANVAVAVSKLGEKSVFLGKIANDAFGDFLVDEIFLAKVDISQIIRSDDGNTALAFVSLSENGNRDFIFYRDNCADLLYSYDEIDKTIFNRNDILHYCSVNLVTELSRETHIKTIKLMKENNGIISFDLNIRKSLWRNLEDYKKIALEFIPFADILKVSDEDIEFLTETFDKESHREFLKSISTPKIIIYTSGNEDIEVFYNGNIQKYKTFNVIAKDTTGAGDSFIGAFLYCIMNNKIKLDVITETQMKEFINFSSAAAAITVSNFGAMNSIPSKNEVVDFIRKQLIGHK